MIRGLDEHIQGGIFADGLDDDEETDAIKCPDCDSTDTYPDESDDSIVWCNNCGAEIDPDSGESREAVWEVALVCSLEQMTKSEATAYVEEMLDHIEKACGYRLYLSI